MVQESRGRAGRVQGASLKTMLGTRRTATGPDSRFTRRHHRLRADLVQLLFIGIGLVAGIFVPKITVSPLVSSGKIVLVVGALAFIRALQTRAFISMLLAPTLTAITERGREILDGLYPPIPAARPQPVDLPSPNRTVTWADHLAVLQQLHLEPLVDAASAAGSVVVLRQTVGATLLPGLPVADVHGGDPGQDAVLRAVVTGPERTFDQDPLLAFRLLADIALRALSPAVNDPATAVQAIDSLEDLLSLLAARTGRADQLTDDAGAVRVILSLPRWDDFARSFLDDLIAAAADTPMVLLRLRDLLARLGKQAPPAAAGIVATRAAWVDDSLARKFPLIWADTATTGRGQLATQPPGSK